MGYRSDVAIAMKKSDYDVMLQRAKELEENSEDVCDFIEEGYKQAIPNDKHQPENPDDFVYLFWEWVKWYTRDPEYFPEVTFIDDFLSEIDEYDFVRIGEEEDDTETIYNSGSYLISVERSINWN